MKIGKGISIVLAVVLLIGGLFPFSGTQLIPAAYAEEAEAYDHAFYVAPNGNDNNDGSIGSPFATLERARDAIRALKSQSALTGSAVVYLRGGTYFRNASFQLEEQDSGVSASAPIVYRAYGNESVRLMGGYELNNGLFQSVTDPGILSRLPETARGKVLQLNLQAQNITEYGQLGQIGWGEQDLYQQGDDFLIAPELFINGEAMTLARWPNEGYVTTGQVLDKGTIAFNYWNKKPGDPGYVPPEQRVYNGAKFKYTDNRPDLWTQANDIWMFGYWVYDWADATTRIDTIDRVNKTILTDHSLAFGVNQGKRYYYFNLLEEIDVPGEWYLDRTSGVLYLYPPAPIQNSTVQYSVMQQPMVNMTNVSNVTFQGLTLEIMRGKAVKMSGGSGNLIAGNTFRFIGEQAVYINGGTNHGVVSNDIYATGTGGIRLGGGNRQTLTPAGHYADNNTIQNFARNKKTYSPAINLGGVGIRASHNLIHDAPHLAIQYGGNDLVIEKNEIYDVLLSTDDAGGVYSGRSWTSRGNVIRNNFFHHTGNGLGTHGNHTIYYDDGLSGVTLTDNVFYQVSDALFNHGGRDHKVENNLVIDSSASFKMMAIHPDLLQGNMTALKADLAKVPYQSEPWSSKYPELVNILNDEPEKPKYNRIEGNVYINTPAESVTSVVYTTGTIRNNLSLAQGTDPGFVDAANMNFQLKPDSVIFEQLPQFRTIPIGETGLKTDVYRTSLPQLGAFNLVSPDINEEGVNPGKARFSWQKSVHADQYRLVVAADPEFSTVVKDQIVRGTSVTLTDLSYNQRYYWKVQAQSKSKQIRNFIWNEGGPASFLANGGEPVTGVKINPGTDFIASGSQVKVTATITPENSHQGMVSWSSNHPEIAPVDEQGTVTGITYGDAEITVASKANPSIKDTVSISVIPQENVLLNENFEDGTADGWTEPSGYAKVVKTSTGNYVYRIDRLDNKETLAYLPQSEWRDSVTEFKLKRNGHIWSNFGIRVKYDKTTNSFYNFLYLPYENRWSLYKVTNGVSKTLAVRQMTMDQGKNYLARVETNGSYIGLKIDGVPIIEVSDSAPLSGGGLGLYVYNGNFEADDLRVVVPPKPVLYYDDFEDGIADGWTESSGYAKVVKNTSGNFVYRIDRYENKETFAYLPDNGWQDYSAEMTMKRNGHIWSAFGLRIKYDKASNSFYNFLFRPYENKWVLQKVTNGAYKNLASYPMTMDQGKAYSLKAEANGSHIRLYIDGVKIFDVEDTSQPLPGGGLGLYVYNGNFEVDQVKVTKLQGDRTPPVTTAQVEGTLGNDGWYVSPATVSLAAADERSCVALTEYKLSVVDSTYGTGTVQNAVYLPYTGPITVTEGVYKLTYRSKDKVGNVEADKELLIKVDTTAPSFRLTGNGSDLTDGTVYGDDVMLTLSLTSEDALSGVAVRTMMLDGQVIQSGSVIDLAGKPGIHSLNIIVTDLAGNTSQAVIQFEVKTSISSLRHLLARFEASGDLKGPLVPELVNSLDQAEHHLNIGSAEQAILHMDNFVKHLENPPMQEHVSESAKAMLRIDAMSLIGQWS